MYEDDFIKVIKYYLDYYSENLPKTFNLSYTNKYKLSDIANMILNKDQIKIMDSSCSNYCGDGTIINSFNIKLDGLEDSLKKYAEQFL
jgi:hypothetical protein